MPNKRKVCKTIDCERLVIYRNGIPTSKWCPNHYYKRIYKKSSIERAHDKVKVPKPRTPRQRATDRADEWFSRYIRLKYSIVHGGIVYCRCYTCGMPHQIKNIDCGHYIGRGDHPIRWHINNARPQGKQCNYYRSGEHRKFEQNLKKEIGTAAVEELKQKAEKIANYSVQEIRDIAKLYRLKVRRLEKEIGIKVFK